MEQTDPESGSDLQQPSAETVTSKATHDNNRKRKLKLVGPENGSEGPSEPKESAPMEQTDPESGSDLQQLSDKEFHNVTSALDALVKGGALGSENAWRLMIALRGRSGAGPARH